mmetsp:Transcript_22883/g.58854  ORF Transcript_22883/g.58854 Transcript_22883/m.58854 type:complete len:292 (-) Transcript_22883:75-950(-)
MAGMRAELAVVVRRARVAARPRPPARASGGGGWLAPAHSVAVLVHLPPVVAAAAVASACARTVGPATAAVGVVRLGHVPGRRRRRWLCCAARRRLTAHTGTRAVTSTCWQAHVRLKAARRARSNIDRMDPGLQLVVGGRVQHALFVVHDDREPMVAAILLLTKWLHDCPVHRDVAPGLRVGGGDVVVHEAVPAHAKPSLCPRWERHPALPQVPTHQERASICNQWCVATRGARARLGNAPAALPRLPQCVRLVQLDHFSRVQVPDHRELAAVAAGSHGTGRPAMPMSPRWH